MQNKIIYYALHAKGFIRLHAMCKATPQRDQALLIIYITSSSDHLTGKTRDQAMHNQ